MSDSMADRHEAVPTITLERLTAPDHGALSSHQVPIPVLVEGFTSKLAIFHVLSKQADLLQ